ncbi:MAG: ABC transporter ATP-binding protein [Oscillospiraceae bacterium]|jgi:spermidine/putrescine transport system ATP-binding protein|nr:ABC transporter ATP-binding protein [Oscillospiraceae bacterium]
MSQNTIVNLQNIVVNFDGERVLKGIDLAIRDKEFVTLLGPSGCGKTTTLRVIGGFVKPDAGDVYFGEKKITSLPPHKREVNTVFQRYALFPHLNVYENIAFGLRLKRVPDQEVNRRVLEMLELVNLSGFGKRKIEQMSGGQQQRVAIARALVNHPKVLLLDEPLGALDLKLRKEMQNELKRIQKSLEITFVYVTHDQEEALTMSDTVVVMKEGVIQQIGTPQDIYNEPVNSFVADFIGESNIIGGIMREDFVVEIEGTAFDCVDKGFSKNEEVEVVIRPEDLIISPANHGFITGMVESVTFKGVHYEIIVDVDGFKWMVHTIKNQQVGEHVGLVVSADDIHVMKKGQEVQAHV